MSAIVSYLIPSYNHAQYLPLLLENLVRDIECLEVPAEVIIIDDGSKDNSTAIISDWVKDHAHQFSISHKFQENKGLANVLNTMVAMAQGEFLRLCASDDLITIGSTQKLLEEFTLRPKLLCVFGDAKVINESGEVIHDSSIVYHGGNAKRLANPRSLTQELIQHWCIAGPSLLIKKNHYETMRYDETSKIDDYDLFLSLLEKPEAIIFCNDTVCSYRLHATNTSKTKNKQKRIENIKYFLQIIDRYISRRILAKYLSSVRYKTMAKIYFLQKKYLKCAITMFLSIFSKIRSEFQN